ncbi:transcriptional regulator [Streptomyces sp. NPDC054940]
MAPRTVVWLNEAQHYFGAVNGVGERIAAGAHRLLTGLNGAPILVLGTLWPEYAQAYSALPAAGQEDQYPRVRELLAGRLIPLPDSFDHSATEHAQRLASEGDRYLANAVKHARDGRFTQFLAGAPELLRRYHTLSPAARALLHAAMDARRLGAGLHLPGVFLEEAAPDYLTNDEFDDLADNWMEKALADATQSVHGNLAPLRRVRHRKDRHRTGVIASAGQAPVYRLADYLEQHGRRERRLLCPPESFWQAVHERLTPDEQTDIGHAAFTRHRLHWSMRLFEQAAQAGGARALTRLAARRAQAMDWSGAEELALRAAQAGRSEALVRLALRREKAGDSARAEQLVAEAVAAGDTTAISRLAARREKSGNASDAVRLAVWAADHHTFDDEVLLRLASQRHEVIDQQLIERLLQKAADAGSGKALSWLAKQHHTDWERAEQLVIQALAAGDRDSVDWLVEVWEARGSSQRAERLARRAADAGDARPLVRLAEQRGRREDWPGAELLARQAARVGAGGRLLIRLAERREKAGQPKEAEEFIRLAAGTGDIAVLEWLTKRLTAAENHAAAEDTALRAARAGTSKPVVRLVQELDRQGDTDGAERLAREAADAGIAAAYARLAGQREASEDHHGAERAAEQAAAAGYPEVLASLAERRHIMGHLQDAERLALWAADAGHPDALLQLALRQDANDLPDAERLLRQAADNGHAAALSRLAVLREKAKDVQGAEENALAAAEMGDSTGLVLLAEQRALDGNWEAALRVARVAVDAGEGRAIFRLPIFRETRNAPNGLLLWRVFQGSHSSTALLTLWPHGLDADGTPSAPM